MNRRYALATFLAVAVAAGLTYWVQADWWYYVQDSVRGDWPKFKATPWEQFLVSSIAGAAYGGAAVGLVAMSRALGAYVAGFLKRSESPSVSSDGQ